MDEAEFQRGVREAEADIAAASCRLFFQTRGSWGERFTELMRDRFGVSVVHVSDISWDAKRSYEQGYNRTVRAHIDSQFGTGSYDRAWEEIEAFREQSYREWFASGKEA
jgi:hypothetical protein